MGAKPRKKAAKRTPWIICVGEPARAVVFGWADEPPQAEKVCTLYDARMILKWAGNKGIFGLAQHGPESGSRITCAAAQTSATARQVLSVSDDAAQKLAGWPSA